MRELRDVGVHRASLHDRVVHGLQHAVAEPICGQFRVRQVRAIDPHHARRVDRDHARRVRRQRVVRRLAIVRRRYVADDLARRYAVAVEHVDVFQAAALDGRRVEFGRRIIVTDADENPRAAIKARADKRVRKFLLHAVPALLRLDVLDLLVLGLPCAPLPSRVVCRDVDDLASDPVAAIGCVKLVHRDRHEVVPRRDRLVFTTCLGR